MQQDLPGAYSGRIFEPSVSWSAIWSGAAVALAASLCLTLAAAGLGLEVGAGGLASRHSLSGFTPIYGATAIGVQVLSAALGGYVAGRLRHAWLSAHGDEAHFRDTAHGLIVWAVSTILGVVLTAGLLVPYLEQLSIVATVPGPVTVTAAEVERAGHILSQSSLFTAIGMVLSAFVAAVAARLGGLRTEEMHLKFNA